MIFLDNASTTKIDKQVNQLIYSINEEQFYNPSALYGKSIEVQQKIEVAKNDISKALNCKEDCLLFTSGATETNNLIIKGFLTNNKQAEYIFSMGEHPSVFEVADNLKNLGYKVNFVNLNKDGSVDLEHFKSLLNQNTYFISIMHVNNETGAINDIKSMVYLAKQISKNVIFHSDGVQAVGKIEVNLQDLGVDAYSMSAHKFHGPKGVGILYCKNLSKLKPLFLGGGQQKGLRSGTENVSGIISTALAVKNAVENLNLNANKVKSFRNYMKQKLLENIKSSMINENPNNSPYILSISFKGLKGEVILHMLEEYDILIGTGSACSSKKSDNRILRNMGRDKSYIQGSIRISFSKNNTIEEIEFATQKIIQVVNELTQKVA